MYIKIYFNDKPLFLCDSIDAKLEPYRHHDDAVYIDEFNVHTVKAMLHEMEKPQIHAGIFLHSDLDALKKAFWKKFTLVQAGGGLVLYRHDILMIHRRGKWDLPKGKLDPGESLEQCALREVQEETGLKNVTPVKFLLTTWHTYHESGKHILKESHWYQMQVKDKEKLTPQTAEDIVEARWVPEDAVQPLLKDAFPSIRDVIHFYQGS